MRFALLLLLAAVAGAADARPLGPNEDLPYCRVVENVADIAPGVTPVYQTHDGWWSPSTLHLFALSDKGELFQNDPLDARRIVKVTPAVAQPGRMPASYRRVVNEWIAKHPGGTPAAATSTPASVEGAAR